MGLYELIAGPLKLLVQFCHDEVQLTKLSGLTHCVVARMDELRRQIVNRRAQLRDFCDELGVFTQLGLMLDSSDLGEQSLA